MAKCQTIPLRERPGFFGTVCKRYSVKEINLRLRLESAMVGGLIPGPSCHKGCRNRPFLHLCDTGVETLVFDTLRFL